MSAYINYIGTAVPAHKIPQQKIADFMAQSLGLEGVDRKKLDVLYRASGIKQRHSVIADYANELDDYSFFPQNINLNPFPSVGKRMRLYEKEAVTLGVNSIKNTLPLDFDKSSISHLITVSCTGMYAPGLDIEITQKLGLKTTINRTAINFMGCYGAFNGLKLADSICNANPKAKVLLVAVELCTIHFQNKDDEDTLLANALFSDGAAAALISSEKGNKSLSFDGFHTDIAFDGKTDMAWVVGDHGFEMKLSAMVPDIIKQYIKGLTDKLLEGLQLKIDEIDHFAIHPGGKRILEVIEDELGLTKQQNEVAYKVLREYGNMSSPTVLFVLRDLFQSLTEEDQGKQILSFAFGPGLTLESMLLKYERNEKLQRKI